MKRALLASVGIGAVVLGIRVAVFAALPAERPPDQENRSDKVVVSVRDVAEDDDLVVVEADITVPAGYKVRLGTDRPDGGGVMVLASGEGEEKTARIELLLVADQIDRSPRDGQEGMTAWRLHYRLRHRGGSAGGPTTNIERPQPPLSQRLDVTLRAGSYGLGDSIEAFRFDGETYRLWVEPPA